MKKTSRSSVAALAAITLVAALATDVMAETVNTVTVTKFHQSYPYSGKATIEYTVSGRIPTNAVVEIVISTDDASATFVQSNIVPHGGIFPGMDIPSIGIDPGSIFGGGGAPVIVNTSVTVTNEIDFASSFGGALVLTNASFVVTISEGGLGGVQLWANGPYWAECNVGAGKPEEYGSYFLRGEDEATANLGSPWRMPTSAEFSALIGNCTSTWITTNGVSGRLFTGKDDYADRCIFLPAAGYWNDVEDFLSPGEVGSYWSSTEALGFENAIPGKEAGICLVFNSASSWLENSPYYYRRSVRPVRDFVQ